MTKGRRARRERDAWTRGTRALRPVVGGSEGAPARPGVEQGRGREGRARSGPSGEESLRGEGGGRARQWRRRARARKRTRPGFPPGRTTVSPGGGYAAGPRPRVAPPGDDAGAEQARPNKVGGGAGPRARGQRPGGNPGRGNAGRQRNIWCSPPVGASRPWSPRVRGGVARPEGRALVRYQRTGPPRGRLALSPASLASGPTAGQQSPRR